MKLAKGVFITATDTGAGKTVVSGLLGRYLSARGKRVITQKWIQTGASGFPEDVDAHLRLMKKTRKDIKAYASRVAPYVFKLASSPHLASSREKKKIDPAVIKKSFRSLSDEFDFVIVEGIGGITVPFSKKSLVIDIARDLALPVIIVAQNRLGAINHTLLTVEAARARRMKLPGIIFNNAGREKNAIILKDNPRIIGALTGEKILGSLPWRKTADSLYEAFKPIGKRILEQLAGGSHDA